MRRLLTWVVAVAVGLFAVVGLWSAATAPAPASVEERAREVSLSLRCPTCAGESIADSSALLSDAMRQTVQEQVRQGRSPHEIRAWFAERYGDEVLLAPPRSGFGWALWAVPVVLVGAAAVVLLTRGRPRRRRAGTAVLALAVTTLAAAWLFSPPGADLQTALLDEGSRQDDARADAVAVLRDAVDHAPGNAGLRLALAGALEQSGEDAGAAEEYAAATRLRPMDPDTRYRHAFALARSGDPESARHVLEDSLETDPDHAPSLLLLGALTGGDDPERAVTLFERFVRLEPDSLAAEQVRAFLDGRADEVPAEVAP